MGAPAGARVSRIDTPSSYELRLPFPLRRQAAGGSVSTQGKLGGLSTLYSALLTTLVPPTREWLHRLGLAPEPRGWGSSWPLTKRQTPSCVVTRCVFCLAAIWRRRRWTWTRRRRCSPRRKKRRRPRRRRRKRRRRRRRRRKSASPLSLQCPGFLQGEYSAGARVFTPSQVAPPVGHHQLPQSSSTY